MLAPRCTGISSVVSDWLGQGLWQPRLLARFDQLVDLTVQTPAGPEIVALCSPRIGNGPLNLVLDPWPDWSALTAATPLVIRDYRLQVGAWHIDCATAPRWNPQPDWDAVRSGLAATGVAAVRRAARLHAPRSPLLALLCGVSPAAAAGAVFAPGLGHLRAWRHGGDPARLDAAVAALAGLGPGLTPAGDDFLCGLILGLWACRRSPQTLCRLIADRAAPLTTSLSAAFLRRAAAGQVSAPWLTLLRGFQQPASTGGCLDGQLCEVVACGHSSGADTLAGFLWLTASVAGDRRGARHCA